MTRSQRKTRQLEVIWAAIRDDPSHPTADLVYEKVRKKLPNVSLGTVYRNLQKLVTAGKLRVVNVGRTQRFDALTKEHQHFICECCGRVYDVFVEPREVLVPESLPHEGFKVRSHQVAFYGFCKHCAG
ncbi:MAG TPA: transcriptional repressor [candidate division Zixibacteria bacterium]|nr:transcriptional repressor [candidate division Zixibacteria bacterium]